jgi:hypothetical protein
MYSSTKSRVVTELASAIGMTSMLIFRIEHRIASNIAPTTNDDVVSDRRFVIARSHPLSNLNALVS